MKRLTLMLLILMACRRAETPIAATAEPVTVTMPPTTATSAVPTVATSADGDAIRGDVAPPARISAAAVAPAAQPVEVRQQLKWVANTARASAAPPRVLRLAGDEAPPNVELVYSCTDPEGGPANEPFRPYDFSGWQVRFELLVDPVGNTPAARYVGRNIAGLRHIGSRSYAVVVPADLAAEHVLEGRLRALRLADREVWYAHRCTACGGSSQPRCRLVKSTPTDAAVGVKP